MISPLWLIPAFLAGGLCAGLTMALATAWLLGRSLERAHERDDAA